MEIRLLGNSGMEIAPLIFGGNVFGWTIDEQRSFELLDTFTNAGFNCIDTADVYARWAPGNTGGESETIIGNWLKKRNNRDKIVVCTKVGGDMGSGKRDISKKYILQAVENSLKRLQTDYIDLYQTHWDDMSTPVEETLEAYNELINQGKIKWIGASNISPDRLIESLDLSKRLGYPVYQSLQPLYNLYDREPFEKEMLQFCLDNNIAVITYFSLASGFLTGKYKSESDLGESKRGAGLKKYFNERGSRILSALDQLSAAYKVSPSVLSLAWLLAQPGVTAPIASATTMQQLSELMQAATFKLDPTAVEILNKASAEV